MFRINKILFLVTLIFFGSGLFGQTEKKQIVLVPYSPVHFLSTFDLAEIAEYNSIDNPENVHQHVLDSMVKYLAKQHPEYSIFQIPESDQQAMQYLIQAQYKDKPIGHYGIDMESLLTRGNYEQMLENLGADYALFITHYNIEKKLHSSSRSFDGSYIIPWARHLVDYELYDKKGNLIALADRFQLEWNLPGEENYLQKGLVLKDMQRSFRSLLKDIIQKEQRYKNKPVYKYRKRKSK